MSRCARSMPLLICEGGVPMRLLGVAPICRAERPTGERQCQFRQTAVVTGGGHALQSAAAYAVPKVQTNDARERFGEFLGSIGRFWEQPRSVFLSAPGPLHSCHPPLNLSQKFSPPPQTPTQNARPCPVFFFKLLSAKICIIANLVL